MSQISRPALGLGLLLSLAFASASLPLLALNPPVPEGPVVPVATTAPWSAPPAVAFLPGGDLLLAANSPADATACQQGLAPCAGGPLVGYAGDRFAPSAATAPFALEESLDQPATSQEIRLANLPAAAGGGFVLAWENDQYCDPQSGLCTGGDGSGSGIAARLFRSAQSPAGPSFQVNTTIAGDQAHPAVAALPNGGFVIVWQGRIGDASAWDLYAQRFNAQAEPLGNELQIPEGLTGDVARSAVAAAADGSFLVAFRRLVDVAPALFVRHFAADGTPDANDVEVDGGADGGLPSDPALTALPGGGYAITWRSDLLSSPTANIWVRRLDVTGLPSGDPVAANLQAVDSPTAGIEPVLPDLAADAAGGLLAVWPNHAAATAGGSMVPIHATYFGSPTDAPSREILVAQVNFPLSPRVVSDGDHAYAVVWSRITTSHGVASQLYEGRRSIVPGGTCTAGTAALCLS
ncbi:MAG TPA: hypothetical protein VMM92_09050, partial [Thermoanaerobaculia bacterium]|nr:hypothetical protein [Thermoanaerobaculia bacterium]